MTLAVSGAIKQCKNGHHICENCGSKVEKCPSCKEKIDIRSLQLEKLREVTPFPCQNQENGCKVNLKLKYLENHQDNKCHHGLLQCVMPNCKETKPLKDLISHLDSQHHKFEASLILGTAIVNFRIESGHFYGKGDWSPWRIKYKTNVYFFLHLSRNEFGIWFAWVSFAGYAPKVEEYWCKIKAFCEKNARKSVVFSGDVIPITRRLIVKLSKKRETD
jgi:hypothetical protein